MKLAPANSGRAEPHPNPVSIGDHGVHIATGVPGVLPALFITALLGCRCLPDQLESVSGKKRVGVRFPEQDVNRDKVSHPLARPNGDRRIEFKAPVAHADGVDNSINGKLLKLQ